MDLARAVFSSERVLQPRPAHRARWWIAAGTGVALLAMSWGVWRNWEDDHWNDQAIAAQFLYLNVQRQNDDVHLVLHYSFTNTTDASYRLPSSQFGILMQRVPAGDLEEVNSVVWKPITIPAGKTVRAEFDVTLAPFEDPASLDGLHDNLDVGATAGHVLERMRGLVFRDFGQRYSIELPRGWQ